MASATSHPNDSDNDSSSSSFTTCTHSHRSCITNISFSSSSRSSNLSLPTANFHSTTPYKPHKSNQAEWEAIRRVLAAFGHVGLDHFRLIRRLGSGDLGNVYLCQLRDPNLCGCLYAMKVVDKDALAFRKKLQRAETEKEILRMLDHPFLPTLYADFEAAHYSCLVMEFCSGGDLHFARQRQPCRRFSVSAAKFYAAETVLALEYLHMMGVVYRDLKPENVLVRDDGHIMLSDFDLSLKCDVVPKLVMQQRLHSKLMTRNNSRCSISSSSASCMLPIQPVFSCFYGGITGTKKKSNEAPINTLKNGDENDEIEELDPEFVAEPSAARSKSFVGTHDYLAPEVISGTGHGSAVDWWTLGVFLYEMIYGRTPFKGEDNEKTLINIIKQPLRFPRLATASTKEFEELTSAQDLITKLLAKNPKRRIGSLKGSGEIKRHEFFKGVNWALIRQVRPPEVPRDVRRVESRAAVIRQPKLLQRRTRKKSQSIDNGTLEIPQHIDYF